MSMTRNRIPTAELLGRTVTEMVAEIRRAAQHREWVQVDRLATHLEESIGREFQQLAGQALAVAEANVHSVEMLGQFEEELESLRARLAELEAVNRKTSFARDELEERVRAVSEANVDAVLEYEQAQAQLAEASELYRRLAKEREELAQRAQSLDHRATALAEANVESVLLAEQYQSRASEVQKARDEALRRAEQLEIGCIVDELTGLYNYRHYRKQIDNEFARAKRYGRDLSLLFVDIDHFKQLNDTYGHEAGNVALQAVGRLLQEQVRTAEICVSSAASSLAARYGGEEFVVVLPETPLKGALVVAQRILEAVAQEEIQLNPEQMTRTTVSLGVTAIQSEDEDSSTLVHRADRALYAAKNGGRNCIGILEPSGSARTFRLGEIIQRKAARVVLTMPLQIVCGDQVFQGATRDVSLLGLGVELGQEIPAQEQVRIDLQLETGLPVSLAARICWQHVKGQNGSRGSSLIGLEIDAPAPASYRDWCEGLRRSGKPGLVARPPGDDEDFGLRVAHG